MRPEPEREISLSQQRFMARARMRRLYREIRRYQALYRSPWLDRMVASLKAEYRATWAWRRELEERWAKGER